MPRTRKTVEPLLSSSTEGYRRRLQAALNRPNDGATIELDITTARAINELLRRLVRIQRTQETSHDPSP